MLRTDRSLARLDWRTSANALAVMAALLAAAVRVYTTMHRGGVGADFQPVYDAGKAILAGRSIYADPLFVYPPTCALLSAIVAELLSYWPALWVMTAAAAAAILVANYAAGALSVRHRLWPTFTSLWVIALFVGHLTSLSMWDGNVSVLLPPIALLICWLASRGRWTEALVLLGCSLLIKPVLAPLLLLPLLDRRYAMTVVTVIAVGVVALVAAAATGNASDLPSVVRHVLTGSNLVGHAESVHNLSLYGLGEHYGAHVLFAGLRVIFGVAFLWGVWCQWRRTTQWDLCRCATVGTLGMTALFLSGELSERHYLLSTLPLAIIILSMTRSAAVRVFVFAGGIALLLPWIEFHGTSARMNFEQLQDVAAECCLFLGALIEACGAHALRDPGPAWSARGWLPLGSSRA